MSNDRSTVIYRFMMLVVLSVALMIIDHRSELLRTVKIVTPVINIPFESVVGLPGRARLFMERYYPDNTLHDRFAELKKKQVVLEIKLQQYDALIKENRRLSTLLSASKKAGDEVLLTEIIDVGLEPFSHKIVVNRGIESGVYLGQPAIAPLGVLGQVSELGYRRSVITLITDSSHGLPVQVERNGLRTIVKGSGSSDKIELPFLDRQADIQQGDVLITSGMGGRFPVGYKVAEVTEIVKDANEAFLNITANTSAQINFSKEVLLVWNDDRPGFPSRSSMRGRTQ
ncbi:MAG: rod shape-determining protein MreC [Gammaproteobacteria bacterium]|nr:rod shape-determining protein MreC [Gammaproteobacteria bacterium]